MTFTTLPSFFSSQRASSITTRIKTQGPKGPYDEAMQSQRASSITTRIKTLFYGLYYPCAAPVREHLPLQQGLRQGNLLATIVANRSQRASSITTRIKTYRLIWHSYQSYPVREHLPLQQGLRRFFKVPIAILTQSESIFHYNKD